LKKDNDDKIISIEDAKNREPDDRLTLKLLEHIRDIRNDIPTNYKLKQELRRVLFEEKHEEKNYLKSIKSSCT